MVTYLMHFIGRHDKTCNVLQGSLKYQPKQDTIIREIPQNYHAFVLFHPPKCFFNDPCVNMSPPFLIVRAAFTTLLTFREIPGYVLFKDPILISWLLLNPLNSQGFGHCSSFAYSPTSFCDFPGNGETNLEGG